MEVDFKCNDCGNVTTYWKSYKKRMPKTVQCDQCKSRNTRRIYGIGHISVSAGKCGNASNGYTSKK